MEMLAVVEPVTVSGAEDSATMKFSRSRPVPAWTSDVSASMLYQGDSTRNILELAELGPMTRGPVMVLDVEIGNSTSSLNKGE